MYLWGVDLGGTKIEGAIVDIAQAGRALWRVRVPTESQSGYDHVLGQTRKLIEELEAASGLPRPDVMGFGTPGTVEPATGTMKNCNTVCLNGRPLSADLSATLGVTVKIANDANCLALDGHAQRRGEVGGERPCGEAE